MSEDFFGQVNWEFLFSKLGGKINVFGIGNGTVYGIVYKPIIIDYWNNTFNRQRLRFRRKGIHVHC